MNVYFACPECGHPGHLSWPGPREWSCPGCENLLRLVVPDHESGLARCLACDNPELYRKKDFPHALGMTILVLACVASTLSYWFYDKWLTWAILIGSAAFDGLLYLWVKDVVVCYRCGAHHRDLPPEATHPPFELTTHERYRQERIRREQLTPPARRPAGG